MANLLFELGYHLRQEVLLPSAPSLLRSIYLTRTLARLEAACILPGHLDPRWRMNMPGMA